MSLYWRCARLRRGPRVCRAGGGRAYHTVLTDIQQLADVSDKLLTRLMKAERSWFWDKFLKLFL